MTNYIQPNIGFEALVKRLFNNSFLITTVCTITYCLHGCWTLRLERSSLEVSPSFALKSLV